jgi:glycosyltransferase involved in cell wall biosynthesis
MIDVSIIIPVYNSEKYITTAIESALSQKNINMKVVVVNDGSTDGSEKKILQFRDRIRYLTQSNKGPAAARNLAINSVETEFIVFLDSDDVLFSADTVFKGVCLLNEERKADILLGKVQIQVEDVKGNKFFNVNNPGFITGFGGMICRRSVFDSVGLLDESLIIGEDLDWFLRAWESGVVTRFGHEPMLYYRRHDQNITKSMSSSQNSVFLKLIYGSLKRRKQNKSFRLSDVFIGIETFGKKE